MSETGKIRVLLIDALGLFRSSLGRYLSSEPDLEVAGECGTADEALAILRSSHGLSADIVLLDFEAGCGSGDDLINAARDAGYRGRFLIITGSADARHAARTIKLGASGIFLKSEPPERLVQVIRLIAGGHVWIDPTVIQLMADQLIDRVPSALHLSGGLLPGREQKVLKGILGGLSNRKIGTALGISESSVKNIIQHLFTKTGVRSRSQLVRIAVEGSLGAVHQRDALDTNGESSPKAMCPIPNLSAQTTERAQSSG